MHLLLSQETDHVTTARVDYRHRARVVAGSTPSSEFSKLVLMQCHLVATTLYDM